MKYYNYTNLEITSAKKPADAYRIIETEAKILYMVDSADEDVLLKSVDKGANWTTVYTDNGWTIEAIFYDYATKYLWIARNDGAGHPKVRKFNTDDSDSATELDQWSSGDAGTYTILALFKTNNKICAIHFEERAGTETFAVTDVTNNPMVEFRSEAQAGAGNLVRWTLPIVVGSEECWFFAETDAPEQFAYLWIDGLPAFLDVGDFPAGYTLHIGYTRTGIAKVDSGYAETYLILTKTATGDEYLYKFNTVGYNFTERGKFDLLIQHDYLSQSTTQEKAFHTSEYKIYQFQKNMQQLNIIAVPDTGEIIIAITDNFLITTTGKMFEYVNQITLVSSALLDHEVGEASQGIVTLVKGSIPIVKNMFLRFYHNYTTATATSEEIVFEGLVTNYTEDQMQTVTLVNPAKKEIKTILPAGAYTKDTDGLISQLIIDYNNYVTGGTLSDGGDLGTITLGGVHTEETIFDGCAKFDGFEWYFNPTGQLFYNNGTVDSGVNYTEASVLSGVNISHVHEEYNRIKVKGAYVAGVQVESVWQEDLDSQQRIGINERVFLISFLNTIALCNTAASNILTLLAKDPIRVKFTIKDTTKGYVQVGETITFEYAASGKVVASDQFIITSATINKYGDVRYTIVSELS